MEPEYDGPAIYNMDLSIEDIHLLSVCMQSVWRPGKGLLPDIPQSRNISGI